MWHRQVAKNEGRSAGLTGYELEQAVMAIALQHPDLVHYQGA